MLSDSGGISLFIPTVRDMHEQRCPEKSHPALKDAFLRIPEIRFFRFLWIYQNGQTQGHFCRALAVHSSPQNTSQSIAWFRWPCNDYGNHSSVGKTTSGDFPNTSALLPQRLLSFLFHSNISPTLSNWISFHFCKSICVAKKWSRRASNSPRRWQNWWIAKRNPLTLSSKHFII